jgi:hypothetical protein
MNSNSLMLGFVFVFVFVLTNSMSHLDCKLIMGEKTIMINGYYL